MHHRFSGVPVQVRWRLFRESCYPYEGNYVKVGLDRNAEPALPLSHSVPGSSPTSAVPRGC